MEFKNPYIFFCNAIGDYIMALPTLRALNQLFEGRLSIVYNSNKINEYLLSEFNFRCSIGIEFNHSDGERRFDPVLLSDKMQDCDLFLYLNTWIYSEDIRILLNGLPLLKKSAGYYSCFSNQIPYSTAIHNFDLYFRMVHLFDKKLSIENFSHPPKLNEAYENIYTQVKKTKLRSVQYLSVHFDSEPEKSIESHLYRPFLEKILDDNSDIFIIPLGLEKIKLAEKYEDRIINFGKPLPFLIATAYLSCSDYFIGVDSCFLHLADLFQVPSTGLFGPTSEVEFGFRFNKDYTYICPETRELKDIDYRSVYKIQ